MRISCSQGGILVLGEKNKIVEEIFKEQLGRMKLESNIACQKE
jgi:hypothetical protein